MSVVHIESVSDFMEILQKNELVLADFYTNWCPPCRLMTPIFEKLSNIYTTIKFAKVNLEQPENKKLAVIYSIKAIPTFIFFSNGKEVCRQVGAVVEEKFREWIERCSGYDFNCSTSRR